jgi:hypothetical protein
VKSEVTSSEKRDGQDVGERQELILQVGSLGALKRVFVADFMTFLDGSTTNKGKYGRNLIN